MSLRNFIFYVRTTPKILKINFCDPIFYLRNLKPDTIQPYLIQQTATSELFRYEVFVSEAFVLHVLDDESHLVYSVILADIVPCCELFRIAG